MPCYNKPSIERLNRAQVTVRRAARVVRLIEIGKVASHMTMICPQRRNIAPGTPTKIIAHVSPISANGFRRSIEFGGKRRAKRIEQPGAGQLPAYAGFPLQGYSIPAAWRFLRHVGLLDAIHISRSDPSCAAHPRTPATPHHRGWHRRRSVHACCESSFRRVSLCRSSHASADNPAFRDWWHKQ